MEVDARYAYGILLKTMAIPYARDIMFIGLAGAEMIT